MVVSHHLHLTISRPPPQNVRKILYVIQLLYLLSERKKDKFNRISDQSFFQTRAEYQHDDYYFVSMTGLNLLSVIEKSDNRALNYKRIGESLNRFLVKIFNLTKK